MFENMLVNTCDKFRKVISHFCINAAYSLICWWSLWRTQYRFTVFLLFPIFDTIELWIIHGLGSQKDWKHSRRAIYFKYKLYKIKLELLCLYLLYPSYLLKKTMDLLSVSLFFFFYMLCFLNDLIFPIHPELHLHNHSDQTKRYIHY